MNGKKRLSRQDVDRMARKMFAQAPIRGESPDTVFLAAFRRKLGHYKKPPETTFLGIGRLSWNLAPLTALAILILGVGLILEPGPQVQGEAVWEQVLTEIADDQKTEVSHELLVEAVLLGPNGR